MKIRLLILFVFAVRLIQFDAYAYSPSVDTLFSSGSKDRYNEQIARNNLVTGNISEAISAYSRILAKDTANSLLISEDAYALAVGGFYDAALIRMDRIWNIGCGANPEVNFYVAQALALMGYDDIANEFWNNVKYLKAPSWISSEIKNLSDKFKRKQSGYILLSGDLKSDFKRANELAFNRKYFEAIILFDELTKKYPNVVPPYLGYAITLERAGAYTNASKVIDRIDSIIGDNPKYSDLKSTLANHQSVIRKHVSLQGVQGQMLGQPKAMVGERPPMMAYLGGTIMPSSFYMSGKLGYFMTDNFNASMDVGLSRVSQTTSSSLGLSMYAHRKTFVWGLGLQSNYSDALSLSYKASVGLSFMNKSRTSSFDVLWDCNIGLSSGNPVTLGLSIGKSFYFGKRK